MHSNVANTPRTHVQNAFTHTRAHTHKHTQGQCKLYTAYAPEARAAAGAAEAAKRAAAAG